MSAHLLRPGALVVLYRALRSGRGPGGASPSRTLAALPRLVLATTSGRYRGTSRRQLALMGAAAAYVLAPVDLVPELVLPVGGLLDDTLVIAWLSGAVLRETGAFLAWERAGGGLADGGGARTDGGAPETVVGEVVG